MKISTQYTQQKVVLLVKLLHSVINTFYLWIFVIRIFFNNDMVNGTKQIQAQNLRNFTKELHQTLPTQPKMKWNKSQQTNFFFKPHQEVVP